MARTVSPSVHLMCALLLVGCAGPAARDVPGASAGPGAGAAAALIGTWDYAYRGAEAAPVLDDFSDYVQDADQVVVRLGFLDEDTWWLGFLFDGEMVLVDGVPEGDGGSYSVTHDRLTTTGSHGEVRVVYDLSSQGRTLTLRAVEECSLRAGVPVHCERDRAEMEPLMLLATEHTYTRSGDDGRY